MSPEMVVLLAQWANCSETDVHAVLTGDRVSWSVVTAVALALRRFGICAANPCEGEPLL